MYRINRYNFFFLLSFFFFSSNQYLIYFIQADNDVFSGRLAINEKPKYAIKYRGRMRRTNAVFFPLFSIPLRNKPPFHSCNLSATSTCLLQHVFFSFLSFIFFFHSFSIFQIYVTINYFLFDSRMYLVSANTKLGHEYVYVSTT